MFRSVQQHLSSTIALFVVFALFVGCNDKGSSGFVSQASNVEEPHSASPFPQPSIAAPQPSIAAPRPSDAPPPPSIAAPQPTVAMPQPFSFVPAPFNSVINNLGFGSSAVVVNAADFRAPVAPGSMASLFGSDFSDKTTIATAPLPYNFESIIIQIGNAYGLIFFVSPNQINFLVPATLSPGNYPLVVLKNGSELTRANIEIAAVSPALFTANNRGLGAPKGQSYTEGTFPPLYNTNTLEPQPVAAGSDAQPNFLILFGTGFRNRSALEKVTARLGDHSAQVTYAGPQGTFDGLDQVNIKIPPQVAVDNPKTFSLRITVDGTLSNWTRVCIAGRKVSVGPCASPAPAKVSALFGTGQVSAYPYAFRDLLTVRVEDPWGAPLENTELEWSADVSSKAVWLPFTSTRTDSYGVSSNEAKTLQINDYPGVGAGAVGVRVKGSTATNLTANFDLTAMTLPFFGQVDPQITYINLPEEILVPAGTTLKSAFAIGFVYPLGPAQSKPIVGAGLRVSTLRLSAASTLPTAICAGGRDEAGTVLSDQNGVVTCDLKVGAVKGKAILKIRMFGGFDRLVNLNVY